MKQRCPKYATIEKVVGETPLHATERLRESIGISAAVPFAYAGRLDPMASGKLLVLIGDECKVQEGYHHFDKEYIFEVLLGAHSDTGDVLGLITPCSTHIADTTSIENVLSSLRGDIELPFPHFSSRTVKGKPLHVWTLEGRLGEIEIPTKKSRVYALALQGIRTISKAEVLKTVREKIETIPKVTDERKALGADFRRDAVRASWADFERVADEEYRVLTVRCVASSGTYMRSLAEEIGKKLGTCGLAYSIHRTRIGTYIPLIGNRGFWRRTF